MKISNSALASELEIRFQVGDNFSRTFVFWQDVAKTIPLDITAKTFSIKVLTGGRSVILDFDDYVIHDTQKLTFSKDYTDMNINGGVYYTWEMKEIGDTVFSIMYGPFFGIVDGGGSCASNVDVVINNCTATIDVIATVPSSGGSSGITKQTFSQTSLILDDNGNYYLPLTDTPISLISNGVSVPGFTYDKSFSPARLYGFSGNYTQSIEVVTYSSSATGITEQDFNQTSLNIDDNGNWYLELLTGTAILVISNDASLPGFTYDNNFDIPRVYGFSDNYTQDIIITTV